MVNSYSMTSRSKAVDYDMGHEGGRMGKQEHLDSIRAELAKTCPSKVLHAQGDGGLGRRM